LSVALDDMGKPFKKVYQFKITLRGIRPPIWRRIQVPEHCTFCGLHVAIQDALGWLDYHLHVFHVVNPKTGVKEEIGIPDEDYAWDVHEIRPGWELPISRYFTAENNKCLYIYDFGDDWEGLSFEEKCLGEIMLDHEDEFYNEFEFADVTHDRGYDPDTEVNPFLHIFIHSIVENQLAEKDPIEVFQFYNGMRKKRCSHHETIHMIGAILAPLLFSVLKYQETFDLTTYRELLKKYKTRNPAKLFELLEKEPRLYPPED
jgi:hypothetical protein